MKLTKSFILASASALMMMLLLSGFASADIIPENSHPVNRCVKIVNLDEFPDMVLVGFITGPGYTNSQSYLIKSDECLTKGYKFNQLHIYAFSKKYFEEKTLAGINITNQSVPGECPGGCFKPAMTDSDAIICDEDIEPYGGYVSNREHLISEEIEYRIAGFSEGKLMIFKSQRTFRNDNSKEAIIELFDPALPEGLSKDIEGNEVIIPEPDPEPNQITEPEPSPSFIKDRCDGFWGSIKCFFQRLFG